MPDLSIIKRRFSIIGNSPDLETALEHALMVAGTDLSVLVIGESGSGKEFFPQIIHTNSSRKHNRYIAVNCGAIPEGTIDSELFGHEKGSFTGAIADHKGYFEEADGGTIFLDEVAELPLSTQARLLRVLESGEYLRVGSSVVKKTNVRVVAATNKDLQKAIKDGKFREDLFYRLSTVQINVPPLRKRGNDILLLVRKFNNDFSAKYQTPTVQYDESARQTLLSYRWPGNVRQLKNIVEQIALFEAGKQLNADDVRRYLPTPGGIMVAGNTQQDDYRYSQEREMLFQMLFQMQQEITRLKDAIETGSHTAHINDDVAQLKRETKQLMSHNVQPTPMRRDYEPVEIDSFGSNHGAMISHPAPPLVHEVPAVPAEEVPATQKTLEQTEREAIVNALARNGGRRKKTAEELKISERTLYRKIKAYGLEARNTPAKKD